jgi:hypothetical protein
LRAAYAEELDQWAPRLVGLYTLNAVDPWLERRLVSTLAPIK